MSFYPQPDKYRCGPFALKHALVMLGVFKHEDDISEIAGSNWWDGTDEIGLEKAARKFNCKMDYIQSSNPQDAKRYLINELKKGFPCLLSINGWEHWVAVVNYSGGYYVMIDSELDRVITVLSGDQLLRKWKYKDYWDGRISYDGYAIKPKFIRKTKAKITLSMARSLMYKKNNDLSKNWDQYFTDLISICKPRTKLTTKLLTFSEFLRRNEESLVTKVANWHGDPSYAEIKKVLKNMEFIAGVYDLIVPLNDEKKALIDITSLLMMYACGRYGMSKFY